MTKLYCLIYTPTGEVCEAVGAVCYSTYRSQEEAQRDADHLNARYGHHYEPARLPSHLNSPRQRPARKQFRAALRRLANGVSVYRKRDRESAHKQSTFSVVESGSGRFQGVIVAHTDFGDSFVAELWEASELDTLRRIACGYYPSLCRAFGPARLYAGA